jgi:hypothetical protein
MSYSSSSRSKTNCDRYLTLLSGYPRLVPPSPSLWLPPLSCFFETRDEIRPNLGRVGALPCYPICTIIHCLSKSDVIRSLSITDIPYHSLMQTKIERRCFATFWRQRGANNQLPTLMQRLSSEHLASSKKYPATSILQVLISIWVPGTQYFY